MKIENIQGTLFETHLHTSEGSSCATSTLRSQLRRCRKLGIHVLAITDHNTLVGNILYLKDNLRREFPELLVIPGIEVSVRTDDGEVHLLVYAERASQLGALARAGGFPSIDEFEEALDSTKHYVIWAHPGHGSKSVLKEIIPKCLRLRLRGVAMRRLPEKIKHRLYSSAGELSHDEERLLGIINGIEAVNGARGDLRRRSPKFFQEDVGTHPQSGGSDTHITGETGGALTVLEGNPKTAEEALALLRTGRYHPIDAG
jgi:hypothetical protein